MTLAVRSFSVSVFLLRPDGQKKALAVIKAIFIDNRPNPHLKIEMDS